jgi:hypothetical protein
MTLLNESNSTCWLKKSKRQGLTACQEARGVTARPRGTQTAQIPAKTMPRISTVVMVSYSCDEEAGQKQKVHSPWEWFKSKQTLSMVLSGHEILSTIAQKSKDGSR